MKSQISNLKLLVATLLLCVFALNSPAGLISSYPNGGTLGSNDMFIIERGPGVGNFNLLGWQVLQSLSLQGLIGSNIIDGPIPSGVLTAGTTNGPGGHLLVIVGGVRFISYDGRSLTNVIASAVASQGTNYGVTTATAWTNTLGTNVFVCGTNNLNTAVFNSLGTNVVPAAVNPKNFPLGVNAFFTNSGGTFFYYTP